MRDYDSRCYLPQPLWPMREIIESSQANNDGTTAVRVDRDGQTHPVRVTDLLPDTFNGKHKRDNKDGTFSYV